MQLHQVPIDFTANPAATVPTSDSGSSGSSDRLSGKIMIVDDEPIIAKVVQKYLRDARYTDFVTISDAREAVEAIRRERPDVLILDVMMPHVNGLQILEVLRADSHLAHLPVLILTAASDDETKTRALELGATDFLPKPLKPSELTARVKNSLVLKAHHDQMAAYSKRLEQEVSLRTAELVQSRTEVIAVLARAAECRDKETGNHVLRVGRYASIIARQLGLNDTEVELLAQAATLHDVGKIGVPDAILLKPGKLDADEFTEMKRHCEYGYEILRTRSNESRPDAAADAAAAVNQSPILCLAATVAISHHEKWDGSGYPQGLAGEAIPIEGRITAVADVFDALNSARPYKEAMPIERCFAILEEGRGQHFDPQVLDAFFAKVDEITKVARDLADV